MTHTTKDTHVDNINQVDVADALKLRFEHRYSYQQIADKYGVSKQAIHTRLSRFVKLIEGAEDIQAYDQHKVKLITAAEMKMLTACIDDEAIEKASLNNRAYAYRQLFETNRLESGKSTDNISIKSITSSLSHDMDELTRRKAALIAQLDD